MGKKAKKKPAEEVNLFNKTDLQRVGLFKELGYVTINDRYNSVGHGAFNEAAGKGKQLVCSGTKMPDATMAGYFDNEFARVFVGEAYQDPVRLRRQARHTAMLKNLGKDWVPNSFEKMPCGLGSFCPCINCSPPAFSPAQRPKKRYVQPGRNFFTSPGKKGTGYGYPAITIGKNHEHAVEGFMQFKEAYKNEVTNHRKRMAAVSDRPFLVGMHPRAYFTPNPYFADRVIAAKDRPEAAKKQLIDGPFRPTSPAKLDGGMKAGTINPYPTHSYNVYRPLGSLYPKNVVNKSGRIYYPPQREKTRPSDSILFRNVDKAVNNLNYKTVETVMQY